MPRNLPAVLRPLALLATLAVLVAACGSGGSDSAKAETELVDVGTFLGDPPAHIDPALNASLDAYQVVNLLYDGLTDIDVSHPDEPVVRPLVAESYEPNADATEWTFRIRPGQQFSDGEPVLPSSFARAWERASDPELAGPYSYLFDFIEGGAEKLSGKAKTLAGVTADDDTMTLVVALSEPYANFDAVAGFQLFMPMPEAVERLDSPADWENGLMIGNGPYRLAEPRSDREVVLERNDRWGGDVLGHDRAVLDRLVFRVSKDPDSAFNAFEAGEADSTKMPPTRIQEAADEYGDTLGTQILGSYHYEINWSDPTIGGPENVKFRQAISQAIDREEMNRVVWNGSRTIATGITPPGIPGSESGLCDYCAYDLAAARAALADWKVAGHSQPGPLKIQYAAGNGHENVVALLVDDLKAAGIEAQGEPIPAESYLSQLGSGACRLCSSGWFADYPTYDNFMFDLFHERAIGGNNHGGYDDPAFNALVDRAKATVDAEARADLFHQAEQVLLNQDIGVIPLVWYRGTYAYDEERFTNFTQTNLGLVLWDQISPK